MPNVLMLKSKETGELIEGRGLIDVDNQLCKALEIVPDDCEFYRHWIDRIGFRAAFGSNYSDLREQFKAPEDAAIIDWLEANYDLACYAEIGKR